MKKLTTLLIVLVLLFLLTPNNVSAANSITNRLKGRLLLQVEQGGAIWYVNPIDLQKYQVTWANALPLFQSFALGITDSDLVKIPADVNSIRPDLDSDNDGYTDISELNNGFSPYIPGAYKGKFSIDKNLANRLKGRLLLQVQQGGAIWYVDHTGVRHNVRWDNLMNLFTRLALGITDADLAKVGTGDFQTDNRILLTPQNVRQYNDPPNCNEKFNLYPANTTVTYSNSNRGISLEIPYNSSWGSDKYRVNPYDENNNRIEFGPIRVFEGCSWVRSYFLNLVLLNQPSLEVEYLQLEIFLSSLQYYLTNQIIYLTPFFYYLIYLLYL